MTADELDQTYTRLCEAMARVGEAQAPLFLAMVSLALMSRLDRAEPALAIIDQAESACDDGRRVKLTAEDCGVVITPPSDKALSLADRLQLFNVTTQGGEAMPVAPVGAERS